MKRAALFLWLALPVAGYGVYLAWGSPHAIRSYSFTSEGSRYDPFADRTYHSCTYLGWRWHEVTVPARNGRCAWVRFFEVPG